jgi:hypothetical protein
MNFWAAKTGAGPSRVVSNFRGSKAEKLKASTCFPLFTQ